jgi:hypothetical protein
VLEDEKRKAQDQLEALLLDGLRGGKKPLTPDDFKAIRKETITAIKVGQAGR